MNVIVSCSLFKSVCDVLVKYKCDFLWHVAQCLCIKTNLNAKALGENLDMPQNWSFIDLTCFDLLVNIIMLASEAFGLKITWVFN